MAEKLEAKFNTPTIFVIFGITGDLAKRKIISSLFDLYEKKFLPEKFQIVGFAHSDHDDRSIRNYARDILAQRDPKTLDAFIGCISYVQGGFTEADAFTRLAEVLQEKDDLFGQCSNKLFHLAIPPRFYEDLLMRLADSGLTEPCDDTVGWTRVLIEKPFGRDVQTASDLDHLLAQKFQESQIYRIDHYLAKETVQNIMMFRFANALFTPVWNSEYIEEIKIQIHETVDADDRGSFYDDIGALRDVGQNHILQLLSAIMMEYPETFTADAIREERARVIQNLQLLTDDTLHRGQYKGFRKVKGVQEHSTTETFFHTEGEIASQRWRGTKVILEVGKALSEKVTRVTVTFREPEKCFCPDEVHMQNNRIIFDIQPEEKITVDFFAKEHGFGNEIGKKSLGFGYHDDASCVDEIEAYERVLHDAVIGDQTLFTSTNEVIASWEVIMPIFDAWQKSELLQYEKGSDPQNIK